MSANFVGNTLTQSEAIKTDTPYDFTSSRPRKTIIAFFADFGGIEKLFCASDLVGPELKFENYESVQHRLQFSGIKKGAKISFHRHFMVIGSFLLQHLGGKIGRKNYRADYSAGESQTSQISCLSFRVSFIVFIRTFFLVICQLFP